MAKQYTKNLIKKEFIAMLEEMPFSSITISMLADRCEINRNTFYYHYDDIYTLVKELLKDEIEKVDLEFDATSSWESSMVAAVSFLLDNKKAAQNIFKSIDRKDADTYLYEVCESVMERYIENECNNKNIKSSDSDKRIVIDFYRAALVGLLDKWIQDGMKETPEKIIYRIGKLFDGNIERSLRISEDLTRADPFGHNN